uniref:Uncharacterized protein n=1 Tax=Photinus pyralis TaxID=7054 RepID=A0A1Y1LCE7_PHOPY
MQTMEMPQTWDRFRENARFFWESYIAVSIMRNCIVLVFVLAVVNSSNTQITGAVGTTRVPSFITPDPNDSKNKNEENGDTEGGVSNIQIEPEYNSTRNKIILNVSWDKPSSRRVLCSIL